ncbi:NrfD/PsrC family molybdoenzyme membrane anchor subunit [Mycobacterium sp. PSTR-4-N]|uniref:NrfD/PsrC family molybdoenzyme membrane anchor subunit n=1 Tax=Mycobacterium sp. PSTR-4-N TaxID=2917745 RepID=UPI001F14D521|nr:NrfD/PsrC family molybdoenzyme membrane anchor subunit [Mycobacterium sp. PSTR-4-N]MCG7593756.1 polysulfide reductase NrfD [Mycobacterium sp. PSTR-4-N]
MDDRQTGIPADTSAPPDRAAITCDVGRLPNRRRRRGRGEKKMVPDAHFESYYGKPVLNKPTWEARDIAGYLFLGGLAGGCSVLAAGAELSGRPNMARATKFGALVAISGSLAALIHDLGRPARFVRMLRVFKPSSPMSVGSWILATYGPLAGAAAVTDALRVLPRIGTLATVGAGVVGPAVASYTAALMSDTAVPTWHDGHRQMPFVFVGSAATAAGGLAVLTSPRSEAGPARRALMAGAATELIASEVMSRRMGLSAEPLHRGQAGRLMRVAKLLTVVGAALGGIGGRRSRAAAVAGGAAALAASACTRFGIFHAGVASAEDPKYTVVPQRNRLDRRDRSTV